MRKTTTWKFSYHGDAPTALDVSKAINQVVSAANAESHEFTISMPGTHVIVIERVQQGLKFENLPSDAEQQEL